MKVMYEMRRFKAFIKIFLTYHINVVEGDQAVSEAATKILICEWELWGEHSGGRARHHRQIDHKNMQKRKAHQAEQVVSAPPLRIGVRTREWLWRGRRAGVPGVAVRASVQTGIYIAFVGGQTCHILEAKPATNVLSAHKLRVSPRGRFHWRHNVFLTSIFIYVDTSSINIWHRNFICNKLF